MSKYHKTEDDKDQQGDRPGWSRILLVLLGLLVLNWLLASALTGVVRPSVPYTYSVSQVNANNIQTVTSTGDTIQFLSFRLAPGRRRCL